ncbi:MAG: hypothetical protein ACK501_12335 [Planctomycetota bacterium]|jgi:hypothetical protein
MHLPRNVLPLLAAGLLGACSSTSQIADFARNDLFYVDPTFVTKAPGDRPVFVAPIVDARDASKLPTGDRGFPIVYAGDEFWERPVPEMFAEVLGRGLAQSQLFARVDDRASANALVLKPTLTSFTLGATQAIAGRASFADVSVRVQVFGPTGGDGKRTLLHDQVYGGRLASDVDFQPISPYRLVAPVLQSTMQKLLTGLDGSNVARSEVPLDADAAELPVEATATRR